MKSPAISRYRPVNRLRIRLNEDERLGGIPVSPDIAICPIEREATEQMSIHEVSYFNFFHFIEVNLNIEIRRAAILLRSNLAPRLSG
jgi:hypothetical protein